MHPHNSLTLTCSLEVLSREQLLKNGRAEEHHILALGSPVGEQLSKVCCTNGDISVMTHANYQLEQKQEHKGSFGYLWAHALYPLTLIKFILNPGIPVGKLPDLRVDFSLSLIFNLNVFTAFILLLSCQLYTFASAVLSPVIYLDSNPILSLPTFG